MSDIPAGRTEAGRFAPGHSGNPAGRKAEEFSFNGILRAALAKTNRSGRSVGERLIARYLKLALAGNGQALEALVARIDGKPAQSLTLKGDSDAPLHVRHSARLEQPAKPGLPAPETQQEAAEGELGGHDHPFRPRSDDHLICVQCGDGKDWHRDHDHQAPDVAE